MPTTTDIHIADNRAAIRSTDAPIGRIAMLTADRVEDVEFFYPYYRFTEAGYDVDVLTPSGSEVNGYKGLALRTGVQPIAGSRASDYDALFIPGGLAPSELRLREDAIAFVTAFAETGRVIGAVCHGPQVLISAGLAAGRRMTSWQDVAPEVRDAGADYVDEPVVEDGQFITARKPGDMPLELARFLERMRDQRDAEGMRDRNGAAGMRDQRGAKGMRDQRDAKGMRDRNGAAGMRDQRAEGDHE